MLERSELCGLVAIFSYSSTLSFLSFLSLTGGTYTKVAIKDLDYEITTDNAKGLGKGKTKVAGIGKGSADKVRISILVGTLCYIIHLRNVTDTHTFFSLSLSLLKIYEFVETGKMAKLEEKRAR